MADVRSNIAAYDHKKQELEEKHTGKWVLFHDEELIGVYDAFETAAKEAVGHFGRGPYLIRQVGAPPVVLPASVMYRPVYARG
jgi:hypothetical protein